VAHRQFFVQTHGMPGTRCKAVDSAKLGEVAAVVLDGGGFYAAVLCTLATSVSGNAMT
jgi:hypothetical protein